MLLTSIFKHLPRQWRHLTVQDVTSNRQAVYGYVLMACVEEQTEFLCALWSDKWPAGREVKGAMRALAKAGKIPHMLRDNPIAPLMFEAAYAGFSEAIGVL